MLKINEFNLTLFFRTECNKNATTTIRNTQRHQPISESNARHYVHGRCVYTDATVLTSQRTSHTFVHTRIEHNAQCIKSAYKKKQHKTPHQGTNVKRQHIDVNGM